MFPALAIVFPAIDPVAFSAGPFSIHWYALSYVAGILIGWWYLHRLNSIPPYALTEKALDDIILWIVIGIILGGRLGYVFFYNSDYYFSNPQDILKVWNGGMSFHGGLIGVILAIYLLAKKHRLEFWRVIDLVACVTPIGLALGRIANFINGELYGRVTDVSWGVVFPGQEEARHPSQLYESFLEGFILLVIMALLVFFTNSRDKPGTLSGYFLIFYSLFRFSMEIFREPDAHIGFLQFGFTMGQLLCIPMMLFGIYLVLRPRGKRK